MSASRLFSSPEEQAVCAVSLANYGVFTEHQGGGPLLRTGEFAGGENEIITNFIFHYNNHLKMTPTIQAWIMTPTMDWVKKLQKVRKNWHIFYPLQKFPRLCMSNPVHLSVVKLMIPDISPFSRQTYNRKVRIEITRRAEPGWAGSCGCEAREDYKVNTATQCCCCARVSPSTPRVTPGPTWQDFIVVSVRREKKTRALLVFGNDL